MSASRTPGLGFLNRLNLTHKVSIAALGAVGATSLALAVAPAGSASGTGAPATSAASAPAAWTAGTKATTVHASIATQRQNSTHTGKIEADAFAKVASKAVSKQAAVAHVHAVAAAKAKAKAEAEAHSKAVAKARTARAEAARRAAARHNALHRHTVAHLHVKATSYGDNLNGWINQALSIMRQHDIPGSYSGIYRNVMRESSGNPQAINLWDVNAQNGIPSKGLLQVIPPTFATYHVSGTPDNIYNPVSNIVAACNYAAAKYGSMDNVNSAY
jgi:hypothetical protein